MALLPLAPNLDDRTFQDLVDEAKRLIPRFCPEWTDHNVSDPGVAMIELFAWMTESMLYRLNQVPEKTHITFMDMIGVRLLPPQAAIAELTFLLSAPQPAPVRIPAGTEVATVRTPDWESITFTTTETLTIETPNVVTMLTSPEGARFTERRERLIGENLPFDAFERTPEPDNAWYIGFGGDLSKHMIRLSVQADLGTGPNPDHTPLVWEGWLGENRGWVPLEVERDGSRGLLRAGEIELYIPAGMVGATFGDRRARTWIRARVIPTLRGQYPYDRSPRILALDAESIGGSTSARHAQRVRRESLGFSDGTAGQVLRLARSPVLPRAEGEYLEVREGEGPWTPWVEVDEFNKSGPDDPHYTFDAATGMVTLGPSVRAPNGTIRQYGAIPPKGAALRFSGYHVGGGTVGNVGANQLVILKSSQPYVARVTNRRPATGGADLETLDHARLRSGAALRTINRAVTSSDFEILAQQASTAVARASCLNPADFPSGSRQRGPKPGTVAVVILPVVGQANRPLEMDELKPSDELIATVKAYLDERRLVTTVVEVRPARIVRIAVHASVAAFVPAQTEHVRAEVEAALYNLLNPVTGGPEGEGWPFGRDLSVYDLHAAIQRVPGIGLVEDVRLTVIDERGRSRDGGPRVVVAPDATIASARHIITVAGNRR